MNPRKDFGFPVGGGMNLVDPLDSLPPGAVNEANNVELPVASGSRGGYRRIKGYERYDGQPKPHEAQPTMLLYSNGIRPNPSVPDTPAAGMFVTGSISGATAEIVYHWMTSGDFVNEAATGQLALMNVTGTFVDERMVISDSLSTPTFSEEYGDISLSGAPPYGYSGIPQQLAMYAAAQDYRRDLIQKPPGEGPVRGVFIYKGEVYAFRNGDDPYLGALNTACNLYRATPSGWELQDASYRASFTNGQDLEEGQTLTDATLTITAVIERISITSGDLNLGTATGWLYFRAAPSSPFSPGACTSSGGSGPGSCTLSSISFRLSVLTENTSKFDFRVYNFGGSSDSLAVYGVDGTSGGFEYRRNGSNYSLVGCGPIIPGAAPKHCAIFNNQLWFAFSHGSLQNSAVGSPVDAWTVRSGASEIGIGDEITDLLETRAETLAVYGENSISVLYNTPELKRFAYNVGAQPHGAQNVGSMAVAVDNKGVYQLSASQAFGDFESAFLSKYIDPLIRPGVSCTSASPSLGQYRIFYDDGTGVYGSFAGDKLLGWTQVTMPHVFTCTFVGEDANGKEMIVAGTEDGWVMQLDVGDSFDGAVIQWGITFPMLALGSLDQKKRLYKLRPEVRLVPGDVEGFDYDQAASDFVCTLGGAGTEESYTFTCNADAATDVRGAQEDVYISATGNSFDVRLSGGTYSTELQAHISKLSGQFGPLGQRR